MRTNNYFKVSWKTGDNKVHSALFFFHDDSLTDIEDAHDSARGFLTRNRHTSTMSVWSAPIQKGPWNNVRQVGDVTHDDN
jgi:hypothetical protein